jgi:hypothetical protein
LKKESKIIKTKTERVVKQPLKKDSDIISICASCSDGWGNRWLLDVTLNRHIYRRGLALHFKPIIHRGEELSVFTMTKGEVAGLIQDLQRLHEMLY